MPGPEAARALLPRKIQQIPGIAHGGIGWQGIIPSRAAKMGSIAVDKGIAKLGSPSEFYEQLEPGEDRRAHPRHARARTSARSPSGSSSASTRLWRDLPPQLREGVHERVQEQLPEIVASMTDDIGDEHRPPDGRQADGDPPDRGAPRAGQPDLSRTSAGRSCSFIINFGFFFGAALGFPLVFITEAFPYWWVLPIGGVIIGYVTNWVALWMIFEPVEPRKIGPLTLQGLFIRRQPEVADVYAGIIADDIVTLSNMGDELLNGPQSDRTRWMIEKRLRPAVDRASGRPGRRCGSRSARAQYDAIRESIATEAVEYTMTPITTSSTASRARAVAS